MSIASSFSFVLGFPLKILCHLSLFSHCSTVIIIYRWEFPLTNHDTCQRNMIKTKQIDKIKLYKEEDAQKTNQINIVFEKWFELNMTYGLWYLFSWRGKQNITSILQLLLQFYNFMYLERNNIIILVKEQ